MLITKIYVNTRAIDNIYIHNTSKMDGDEIIYRIVDPGTKNVLTETTVSHKREDGYRKLLIKVLEVLEKEGIPDTPFVPGLFGENNEWTTI